MTVVYRIATTPELDALIDSLIEVSAEASRVAGELDQAVRSIETSKFDFRFVYDAERETTGFEYLLRSQLDRNSAIGLIRGGMNKAVTVGKAKKAIAYQRKAIKLARLWIAEIRDEEQASWKRAINDLMMVM